MAITTLAQLGDTIPTLIEEALFTAQFKAIMRGLCWNIRKGKGSTVNVPYFGVATASVLTEAIDMQTSQTMQDTNVQITPYEVGLKIILTDNVIEDDNEDLKRAAGNLMGDAYEVKRDVDLLTLLDNGTTSLCGTGATLTMGHIAAARATLLGNAVASGGPAPSPYVVVIHPFQELDLVDVLTPIAPVSLSASIGYQAMGGALTEEILQRYSVGRLFGANVVTDGNIVLTSTPDAKGGMFAMGKRGGIIYVSAREATIEPERDASLRGWELNYVGRYGVGNYLNGWTVELFSDATAPA